MSCLERLTSGGEVGRNEGDMEMGRTLDTEVTGLYSPGVHFLLMAKVKRPILRCPEAFDTLNDTSSSENNSVYLLKCSEKTEGELLTKLLLNASDRLIVC